MPCFNFQKADTFSCLILQDLCFDLNIFFLCSGNFAFIRQPQKRFGQHRLQLGTTNDNWKWKCIQPLANLVNGSLSKES